MMGGRRGYRIAWLGLALVCAVVQHTDPITASSRRESPAPQLRKLDGRLRQIVESQASSRERVIIRVRPGQVRTYRTWLQQQGSQLHGEFASMHALAADVDVDALLALAGDPGVRGISSDAPVQASGAATPSAGPTESVALRALLGVQPHQTGRGVGIAVIDSGLADSALFKGRVRAFYDFTGGAPGKASMLDGYGHGTHVAGLAAGASADRNESFDGVAPGANLIVLRVLDASGGGYTSDVISALEFVVRYRRALGVDVINLSLGHPIYEPAATDPLVQAVEAAVRSGIVVVAAAGNFGQQLNAPGVTGYAGITSPGNAPSAITVGAVDTRGSVTRQDDRVAGYSSRGPTWFEAQGKPDLVAPGHQLVAAADPRSYLYTSYPQLRVTAPSNSYMRLSGTSMATGVTSGLVALMIEASRAGNPGGSPPLPPNAVKAILEYTAVPLRDPAGVPYDALTQGAGGLNGAGAVELARVVRTAAPVGSYWLPPASALGSGASVVAGERWPWSRTVTWNDTVATGDTLTQNYPAWSPDVVWGTARTVVWGTAKTVVWGTNVVWEDPSVWANAIVWSPATLGTLDPMARTVVWGTSAGVSMETVAWGTVDAVSQPVGMDAASLAASDR